MSFLSILKTVGTDALKGLGVVTGVAQAAAPIAGIVLGPAASAILTKINSAVVGAELLITGAQQGAAKQASVATTVAAELPTLDAVIQEMGAGASFDPAALNAAINASVAAFAQRAVGAAAADKSGHRAAPGNDMKAGNRVSRQRATGGRYGRPSRKARPSRRPFRHATA